MKLYVFILTLILISPYCLTLIRYTPVLDIPQGKLRGLVNSNGDHWRYLALPYASTRGRFQDPGPAPKWSGVLDAVDMTVSCKQNIDRLGIPFGREDCLFLNIHTPGQKNSRLDKPLPVMVFIHGGGFFWGSGTPLIYDPGPLIKKKVIVVTVNYRLGAFGFLCLRIKEAPGNTGLKDLVSALRWVQRNIRYFGGDPRTVTLFGESAGAASVSHLMLSPTAKGLFHRAIMQSGTALSPFGLNLNPITTSSYIAANLGYRTKNPYELFEIFKNTSATNVVLESEFPKDQRSNPLSRFIFTPCIEKVLPGKKPFLDRSPLEMLKSRNYNRVPVIIGHNNKEGVLYASKYDDDDFKRLNDDFASVIPENLLFKSIEEKSSVVKEIREFYFKSEEINRNTAENLADYFSDMLFIYPSYAKTQILLQNVDVNVYNYQFRYDSLRNIAKLYSGLKNITGAAHTDDLFYLFQPIIFWPLPTKKDDIIIMDRMTTLWTNFAKTGNPTPSKTSFPVKWENSTIDNQNYLILDKNIEMSPLPYRERMEFWTTIYEKYGTS